MYRPLFSRRIYYKNLTLTFLTSSHLGRGYQHSGIQQVSLGKIKAFRSNLQGFLSIGGSGFVSILFLNIPDVDETILQQIIS